MDLKFSLENVYDFIDHESIFRESHKLIAGIRQVHNKTGKGNEFLGWHDLPSGISKAQIAEINNTAHDIGEKSDVVVVIGIGGSYLGAKAVIEALSDNFNHQKNGSPSVLFAGHNLCEDYHAELIEYLENIDFSLVVISKSGTTTEPAIAFRILKDLLEKKYGEKSFERIVAITDKNQGALRKLSDVENYKTFVIPDNVGGRYSVLTPVGLLPVAIAGFDIEELIEGAVVQEHLLSNENIEENNALKYAAVRYALYNTGKTNEILVNYHSKLHYFSEWWKQLFGESEGKENKGIFPSSVNFTTDLHSLGQYIQDGIRNVFETVISVERPEKKIQIPFNTENLDKLNYIAGKRISEVNLNAEKGTTIAHVNGGVPVIRLSISELNAYSLGQLIYFFEKSCAISGYLLDVNPFDQPGVEDYKNNMFALLGKAGYEELRAVLDKK